MSNVTWCITNKRATHFPNHSFFDFVLQMRFALIFATTFAVIYAQGASNSSQTPTSTERVDLNKTILEVEKILDKYPELPKIDRSEILTILQNITEEDNAKLKEELSGALAEEQEKMKLKVNATRSEGKKSVMVVLPFKPEDGGESLEELYTRSPVVVMEEQKQTADKGKKNNYYPQQNQHNFVVFQQRGRRSRLHFRLSRKRIRNLIHHSE